jgi:hypothetical protein
MCGFGTDASCTSMLLAASTAHRRRRARTLANRPAADIVLFKRIKVWKPLFIYFLPSSHHRTAPMRQLGSYSIQALHQLYGSRKD